jgi:hypothetical protein
VWKIASRPVLTALSSTACSCLHNFSAAHFLHGGLFVGVRSESEGKARKIKSLQEWNAEILGVSSSAA